MQKNTRALAPVLFLTTSFSLAKWIPFWQKNKQRVTRNSLPVYKVCISSFAMNPFTEKTVEEFISCLKQSKKAYYEIKKYNAFLDRNAARSQIESILLSQPDLIFTTGATCSQLAKELSKKRGCLIPIVFGGVNNPLEIGLIDSEKMPGHNLTGVTAVAIDWEEQLRFFFDLTGPIRHAVIVAHFPADTMVEKDVKEVSAILRKQDIKVDIVAVNGANEVIQKAKPFLKSTVDVLFCIRDDTTICCMEGLVKICNREGIIIFSRYLDGVEKGAAFGLGVFEEDFGTKSAALVQSILEDGKKVSELPLVRIENKDYQVAINTKTAPLQGLHIDEDLMFVLRMRKHIWELSS